MKPKKTMQISTTGVSDFETLIRDEKAMHAKLYLHPAGGSWSAGIGGGHYAGGVSVEIRGGTVTAVAGGGAQAIGEESEWNGVAGSVVLDGMRFNAEWQDP